MADAIIVLGHKLSPAGELADIALRRVEKGVELLKAGVAPRIVFSGRHGYKNENPYLISEAKAMQQYALYLGVNKRDILLEDKSKDTISNAYFTRVQILEPKNWRHVIVVSSDFHLSRVEYTFRKIYGPDYTLEFMGAPSDLSSAEQQEKWLREEEIYLEVNQWLESIPAGDLTALTNFFKSSHPAYRGKF